jgi:hypothetical protein
MRLSPRYPAHSVSTDFVTRNEAQAQGHSVAVLLFVNGEAAEVWVVDALAEELGYALKCGVSQAFERVSAIVRWGNHIARKSCHINHYSTHDCEPE